MEPPPPPTPTRPLARALRAITDVRDDEVRLVLLMTLNVFVVMVGYYLLKTVREPLILASGGNDALPLSRAEWKAYAAGAQALVLVAASTAYGRLAARWPVTRLLRHTLAFFAACLLVLYAAARAEMPYLGFVFYIWVGVFNVAVIAQFWL